MNATVAAYLPTCERLASSLARPGSRGINGVEFDDLVQEGLVNVWQTLSRGIRPSEKLIRGRMIDFMRWLGRQGVDYETMLPLDDYAVGARLDTRSGRNDLMREEEASSGTRRIRFLGEVSGD